MDIFRGKCFGGDFPSDFMWKKFYTLFLNPIELHRYFLLMRVHPERKHVQVP